MTLVFKVFPPLYFLLVAIFCHNNSTAAQRSQLNQICGPRCVHWVARRLHRNEHQLEDAVEKLMDRGNVLSQQRPSLQDLSEYMESLGLHTRIIEFSNKSTIRLNRSSDVYLITHLREPLFPERDTTAEGHFVVWLETSDDGMQHCWDGLRDYTSVRSEEFRRLCTGAALVVAATSQEANSGVALVRQISFERRILTTAICAAGVGLFGFRFFSQRNRRVVQ